MYHLQPRRGDIHRACCGLSGFGRAVGEALVEALVGRTPLLNLTCFLLATLCHACAHFGDGPGFCRRVHPVAQGSARSAPPACNLPARDQPPPPASSGGATSTVRTSRRRGCVPCSPPASDTRHLSVFVAPHGPASRGPPPACTSASRLPLPPPPPPPASTSRLHLPPPPPHPHPPPFSVWPLSVLAQCAAGGVLAKVKRREEDRLYASK